LYSNFNDEEQYTKPLEIVLNQLLKFSDDYTTADEFDLLTSNSSAVV